MNATALNNFRHAIVNREQALVNLEGIAAARRQAYRADTPLEALVAIDARQEAGEAALDAAEDDLETAMAALGFVEVPADLVRALGGRAFTFDPDTGDLR